jgi:hypothetical protein
LIDELNRRYAQLLLETAEEVLPAHATLFAKVFNRNSLMQVRFDVFNGGGKSVLINPLFAFLHKKQAGLGLHEAHEQFAQFERSQTSFAGSLSMKI